MKQGLKCERQIAEGVDFIKVYSKLDKEAFDAIAETAKENGMPFAGHVPTEISILLCSSERHGVSRASFTDCYQELPPWVTGWRKQSARKSTNSSIPLVNQALRFIVPGVGQE
jgi:hypothetical protein